MAKLKCLACGQENTVGEEACTRCLSSLELRLCSACEAINGHTADRCHSCGEAFANEVSAPTPAEDPVAATEPPQAEPTRAGATKVEGTLELAMVEEPSAPTSLPTRRFVDFPPRRGAWMAQAAVLWTGAIALGLGAAYGYQRYQASGWPFVSGLIFPKVAPAPVGTALAGKPGPSSPESAKAPLMPATPAPPLVRASTPTAEPKVTSAPVSPNTTKSSVAQTTPRAEPKSSVARVTHTRAQPASAETPAPASASVTAPVAATATAAAAAAPAASASAPATAPRARVTHTRAPEPREAAAVAASAPAAATQPPIEKPMNPNPSVCAPAVAALGLCLAK